MFTNKSFLRIFPVFLVSVSMLAGIPAGPARAAAVPAASRQPQAQLASPQGLLNPDGTLNLDGSFSGSLDLNGWEVQADSARGPVFSPAPEGLVAKQAVLSSQWRTFGGGSAPVFNYRINAIAVSGTNVYLGGEFKNANGLAAADYIVKWNGSSWSALGSNGAGDGSLGDYVFDIAVSGTSVYVGGLFTYVNNGGTALGNADYVARWDGSNWSSLWGNGAGNGSLNKYVTAIAVSGTSVYVGGDFTDVNNGGTVLANADYIARWDGSNWFSLRGNGAGDGSLNNNVYDIAVSGTSIYVGGLFSNVNNGGTVLGNADYVARWDGSNWSSLGGNGAGDGSLNNGVLALAKYGTDLLAGGWFTDVNNGGAVLSDADYLAAYGLVLTFTSTGSQDGFVLESAESSNSGGTLNSIATTFRLGDDSTKKQYRGILSFNTGASLPNNAVITKVMLKIKKQGITGGGNPVTAFQGFMADIKKGFFGTTALQASDFQTAANKTYGPFKPTAVSNWYSINLTGAKAYVNKLATSGGLTQIRLRFKLDDNNNAVANYLSLFSGNAPTASRPQLIIQYYVP
jgi:hypothetical protein